MPPIVYVAGALVLALALLVEWVVEHERLLVVGVVGALTLGLLVWLWRRVKADRAAEAVELEAARTADVVALRFVFEAEAAAKILGDLRAASGTEEERLRRLVQRLLDAQLDYRLVALETTKPLPEPDASDLFFFWADGVRQRYRAPAGAPAGSAIAICLHVETVEEIPDFPLDDPSSVIRTLESLRDAPRDVRRLDLWASREPLPESTLRELDPKLLPAR